MKKMKINSLIIALGVMLFSATLTTHAQRIYFGVGGGYGFPAARISLMNDSKSTYNGSTTTYESSSRPMSLGKGINAGLYVGYMLNKNIGAELGASYLFGGKNIFTDEATNTAASFNYKTEMTWKGRMIRLVPTIRMTVGEKKLHPYMKVGFIIGVGSKIFTETHSQNINFSTTTIIDENWEYSGGMSFGFHGGLGLNYMVSDKIGIFVEVSGNYQNWAMKKGSMTKYTVDGVNEMANVDINDREIEFVDSYTETSSGSPDPNQASKTTKFFMPFSSIGGNLGIHIYIGGKTE